MDIFFGITGESLRLLDQMSPYLLLGFLFAGLMRVFMDASVIGRHLGGSTLMSVIKASLFGIPLPLCSCGVLPAAMSLEKEGASKGAVLSFLISTPTTGVDSVLATYSLLGWFFALYRTLASFLAGVFAGSLANLIGGDTPFKADIPSNRSGGEVSYADLSSGQECSHCAGNGRSPLGKIRDVLQYAFITLIGDIGGWLLLGILAGGVIGYFLPEEFVGNYMGSGIKAMFIMLLVGIPMYVCATGSIPIVAALMLKGLNPGAAFVFLLAGPATNAAGMTVIARRMGSKLLIVYLFAISLSSLVLGGILDIVWTTAGGTGIESRMFPASASGSILGSFSSAVLIMLVVFSYTKTQLIPLISSGKRGT